MSVNLITSNQRTIYYASQKFNHSNNKLIGIEYFQKHLNKSMYIELTLII